MAESTRKKLFLFAYQQFAKPLMGFLIQRLGGDKLAAEEVFSETILAAYTGMHAFEHRSSYFTWVCRIALNKIADYYRTQVNERSCLIAPTLKQLAQIGDKKLTPEQQFALEELKQSVRECLNLLPEDKRKLIYLKYWKEMTVKSIAYLSQSSERAVEGKLYRAKLELKEIVLDKHPELALSLAVNQKIRQPLK